MGLAATAGSLLNAPKSLNAATLRQVGLAHFPVAPRPIAHAAKVAEPLALIYDRDYLLYEGPKVGSYWESPTRLQAIVQRLDELGLRVEPKQVAPATYEQLARVHTPRYLRYIKKVHYLPQDEYALIRRVERRMINRPAHSMASPAGTPTEAPALLPRFERVIRYIKAPPEAPRFTRLKPYEAASLAAGGAVLAVDEVMGGQAKTAFALVRPPGHHATRSRNMGFCIFNNAAVAARHAQAAHGAGRVMIIDWDVHHGNGTQEIFFTDPSVLYFSSHQENIYPKRTGKVHEIGAGAGRGFNVNVPLPPRTGDEGFVQVFHELLSPIARTFKPDLIIVSAGQDAHLQDFVAQMRMTDAGFARLTRIVRDLANELCGGKLVFVLEGGYNPKVAARSVETIVRVLQSPADANDMVAEHAPTETSLALQTRIMQVKQTQMAYWPALV